MIPVTLILAFLIPGLLPLDASEEPCRRARAFLEEGDYAEGRRVLMDALLSSPNPEETVRIRLALADFLDTHVGNTPEAMIHLDAAQRVALPGDHPLRRDLREKRAFLVEREAAWKEENEFMNRCRIILRDPAERTERILRLESLIKNRPDYPHRDIALYHLGMEHIRSESYGEAIPLFEEALRLRPAIDYHLPLRSRLRDARERKLRNLQSGLPRKTLLGCLTALFVLFFLSSPWRMLNRRHLILVALVLFAAILFHHFAAEQMGAALPPPPEDQFESPVFFSAAPDSAAAPLLSSLLRYTLLGTGAFLLFALATARYRLRVTTGIANAVFSLLVFSSLMMLFHHDQLALRGRHFDHPDHPDIWARGAVYHAVTDADPWVLTNPKAYPGLNMSNFDELIMQEWVERHYPAGTEEKATPESP